MSKLLQDNYKHRKDRLALETRIQEDNMRSDELNGLAEDVPPARSGFANFMSRAGWGLLAAILVLAVFGRIFWGIHKSLETPKMLNIAGEIFVCDKRVRDPGDVPYDGMLGSSIDRDLAPSEDGQTNIGEWAGQPYVIMGDEVLVFDGKAWHSCHSGVQSVFGGFLGEFFTPNRFHRYDTFMEETASGDPQTAILRYHERLEPYLTEEALSQIETGRMLQRFDSLCRDTLHSVRLPVQIEVVQSGEMEHAFNFTVTVENASKLKQLVFTGSYIEGEKGQIESFTLLIPD